MKIVVLPAAWADMAAGFRFYETQSAGVGGYFREAVIAEIETLQNTAGHHRRVFGWHRVLVRRFPFATYYSQEGETVLVRAVLDCRRDPLWVRRKLT